MQEELSRTTTGGQSARLASNSGFMKQTLRVMMMMMAVVMVLGWGAKLCYIS